MTRSTTLLARTFLGIALAVVAMAFTDTAQADEKFTLTNNTGHGIRVHFYHNNDAVAAIGYTFLDLNDGATGDVDLSGLSGKVMVKIWKKQFIDRYICTRTGLDYRTDYVIDDKYNITTK